jgi:CubicO group peptidase (beta-lactamase class C family)
MRVSRDLLIILAVLLSISTVAVLAQGGAGYRDVREWPDSRVGGLAKELVSIINAGDEARAVRFIEEHYDPQAWKDFPTEDNARWLVDLKEGHGHLDFHSTRVYDEPLAGTGAGERVVAILYSRRKEQWMGLSLQLGAGESGKVRGMVIMPARAPHDVTAAASPLTREQTVRELDGYLRRMTEGDRFSGAVLVARDGEILFEGAYGLASRRFGAPNRPDTRFNLGSMNKMITAVATAQLVEQGRLRYEDTIDKHLPEGWLAPEVARRIRVEHLITHTSGLGDYLDQDAFWNGSRLGFKTLDDFKPLIRDTEPQFEPGTEWAYSNSGFFLLGIIVGHVSGMGYDAYVESRIYEPAGMADTRFFELDRPVPNVATGYYRDPGDGEIYNNTYLRPARGGPAGGGHSTLRDLLAFDRALRGDKLLGEEAKRYLWTITDASRTRMPYGRGFIVGGSDGDRRVGHGGGFPGISSNLEMHVDTGWTVVVLANLSSGVGAGDVTNKINELLPRTE